MLNNLKKNLLGVRKINLNILVLVIFIDFIKEIVISKTLVFILQFWKFLVGFNEKGNLPDPMGYFLMLSRNLCEIPSKCLPWNSP